MTAKQVFEYTLVELNKKEAPSLLLEDYNYFFNKAISQFTNKTYNLYEINQQKTDDLRVLKSTAILTPTIESEYAASDLYGKIYNVDLPDDYLHILNCIVEYDVLANYKCYNSGSKWQQGARRIVADMRSQIIHNYYLRPTYTRPYFYINNIAADTVYPINETPELITETENSPSYFLITFGTPGITNLTITKNSQSIVLKYAASVVDTDEFNNINSLKTALEMEGISSNIVGTNLLVDKAITESITAIVATGSYLTVTPSTIAGSSSLVQKTAGNRYGNRSKVRMELWYGKDNSIFRLSKVYIDYLRSPQFVRLTQEQVDEVEDNSQILEFPDYVAQEIVNELIKLLMENASDPRLQSHIPINQSIANPAQEQQKR